MFTKYCKKGHAHERVVPSVGEGGYAAFEGNESTKICGAGMGEDGEQ